MSAAVSVVRLLLNFEITVEAHLLQLPDVGVPLGHRHLAGDEFRLRFADELVHVERDARQLTGLLRGVREQRPDRKSTRLHASHVATAYAVVCSQEKRTP